MKSLLSLIVISVLMSGLMTGCGPSKQEILRQQMLEAQRIEAAEKAARQKAALREERIVERRQQAYDTLQSQQVLKKKKIQTLFSQPQAIDDQNAYFFNLALQPAKYDYGDKKQRFTVIGMRQLSLNSAFSDLISDWQTKTGLELRLLKESPNNDQLVAVTPNFKQQSLLENNNPNWLWANSLFTDLSWNTSPEKAERITADRQAYLQVGLRFCTSQQCIKHYEHKNSMTQAVAAQVVSVLVVDKSDRVILAEFIRADE